MATSTYLATNNLHFKPLCARLGRGVTWTTTALQQNASTTAWHGHVVRALSKGVLFAGAVICVPLALIEAASLFIIAGLGIAINKYLYEYRSEFLQKYSLKAFSYAIHSTAISVALLFLGLKNPNLPYHTPNALADHAVHLASAGFTQFFIGSTIDRAVGRNFPQSAADRSLNLLQDSHPDILNDVLSQIQRDFNLNLRDRMGEIPNLEDFLNRHPEDRDFVRNFDFRRAINDLPYRERAGELLHRALAETQLIRPAAGGADPLFFELNQSTGDESAYQDRLARLLKNSFLEIHRTPELARCLNKDDDSGEDLLEMLDASTYVPLTTYTQYKELLEPIQCPANFSGNLARYNQRREQLLAAQARVNALTEVEKRILERKILGSNVETQGPVHEAFLAISALAPALYQGPLMTKTALNLRNLEAGNMANIVDTRNLFQRSCQEAIAEINAAAPQPPV